MKPEGAQESPAEGTDQVLSSPGTDGHLQKDTNVTYME
jgi:hypothetical protein